MSIDPQITQMTQISMQKTERRRKERGTGFGRRFLFVFQSVSSV
jgi:hypothetical protein